MYSEFNKNFGIVNLKVVPSPPEAQIRYYYGKLQKDQEDTKSARRLMAALQEFLGDDPVVWWDRGSGGFYLNKDAIPPKHLESPGRIVELYLKEKVEHQK